MIRRQLLVCMAMAFAALAIAACGDRRSLDAGEDGVTVLRLGHFPNVTHVHGLIAHALTREGRGWFEERMGPGVRVEWYTYNAGPSAMEALLARTIDATYVGPNPALNAYVKSKGTEIRVLVGATRGGAALVVKGDGPIRSPADFRGRTVGTPQLGNTQDVSCRAWLKEQGFAVTQTGGDVTVLPTANPDQLTLFQRGDLDAVWTVEPWVSRLELQGGGRVFLDETDAVTTVLVSSAALLAERPELAKKLRAAHRELTEWIVANPAEAKRLAAAELLAETRKEIAPELLDRAWARMRFETRIAGAEFERFVKAAQSVGYLPDAGDVSGLVVGEP